MGYGCTAAITIKVNGIESQELKNEERKFLIDELLTLKRSQVFIKKVDKNGIFFDTLNYYLSFTMNINKYYEHEKLGTLIPFNGSYEIEEYIFEYDNYAGSPIEVLELYIFCFYYSKKFPQSKIELGMGDASFFWSDVEILDGEIVKFTSEIGEDGYDGYDGFKCNQFEIEQLFLSLNYGWLEYVLNDLLYIDDLEKVNKTLLSDQKFIEQVLYKFGSSEDFSPDQIIDYAATELKDDTQFILTTFCGVIALIYTKENLYKNHQESVSYFYENHVSRLLKDEELCFKLLRDCCNIYILNDSTFLRKVKKNHKMECGDIDEENDEDLREYLIRNIIADAKFTKLESFVRLIDIANWVVLKYLPDNLKTNEEIFAYALKKNIKAKDFIPAELLEKSELIKSIVNEKNNSKAKRANTKALAELLITDPERFSQETKGMKFAIDLKKIKELPDHVAEALGKHNGNIDLSGIKELSDHAANHLKGHIGILTLSGLKSMKASAAECLLNHKGKIDFGFKYFFEEISGPFAKLIVNNSQSNSFWFYELKNLTTEVAEIFNNFNLLIYGLTNISDEAAYALSKGTRRTSMEFCDLLELSDESAKYLGQMNCWELSLKRLPIITPTAARNLVQFKGSRLNLSGLKNPSMEVIESLGTFKGQLYLEGIQHLSESNMEYFCQNIQKSRVNEEGTFSLVLNVNVLNNDNFDSILDKYRITKKKEHSYGIGKVYHLS